MATAIVLIMWFVYLPRYETDPYVPDLPEFNVVSGGVNSTRAVLVIQNYHFEGQLDEERLWIWCSFGEAPHSQVETTSLWVLRQNNYSSMYIIYEDNGDGILSDGDMFIFARSDPTVPAGVWFTYKDHFLQSWKWPLWAVD